MKYIKLRRHKNNTERNSLTRMSIGGAIVQLIKNKTIDEIKISEICKRAGVSRMTYYHYYETKQEALQDYLLEIIGKYLDESEDPEHFGDYNHILYTLQFFEQYQDYILGLTKVGCYDILINGVNSFLEEHFKTDFESSIYDLYFYGGALLNTFVKWLENDKKESVEEIAQIISRFSASPN